MKINKILVGFASGNEVKESNNVFSKYIGVAPFSIIAINPTLAEIKKVLPEYQGNEPDYKVKREGKDDGIRVNFLLKLDTDHKDIKPVVNPTGENNKEYYFFANIFLDGAYKFNTEKTKVQVINNYGETCWVNTEMVKTQELPEYATRNGFHLPYRPAFIGEELLIDTIKKYLGIPMTKKYDNTTKTFIPKTAEELKKCEASLSEVDIKNILSGNVSVIKAALSQQPDNKIKYPLVIRRTDDNKEYQEVLTRYPLSLNSGSKGINKLIQDITSDLENGAMANIDFGDMTFSFKEYKPEKTNFEAPKANVDKDGDLPWD